MHNKDGEVTNIAYFEEMDSKIDAADFDELLKIRGGILREVAAFDKAMAANLNKLELVR